VNLRAKGEQACSWAAPELAQGIGTRLGTAATELATDALTAIADWD
jgi:hypothetical protein